MEAYQNEANILMFDKSIANSAGNLCLHFIDNLNTLIGGKICKTDYIRYLNLGFSLKNITKAELIAKIEATITVVDAALNTLTEQYLETVYPIIVIQKKMSTGYLLLHLTTYLA